MMGACTPWPKLQGSSIEAVSECSLKMLKNSSILDSTISKHLLQCADLTYTTKFLIVGLHYGFDKCRTNLTQTYLFSPLRELISNISKFKHDPADLPLLCMLEYLLICLIVHKMGFTIF